MISQLKKDLHDTSITSLCNKIYYYIIPEEESTDTYIEYRIIGDYERNFAGNKNMTEVYLVQVDVFSKGSYKTIANNIRSVLKNKGYSYIDGIELYEEDTGFYHKALRFKYTKFK